ncbi:MAG: nucleotidyltransferase domain-containing protein [bacterium]|nr:nucleotidyltransferase domain-containing protein [bacterium]
MKEIERQIRDAVADIPGIAALLLFGSRARGRARPDSDLDVAVLSDETSREEADGSSERSGLHGDLRIRVAAALAHLSPAPWNRVDVVLLEQAPDTLRQRVMEHGRMILCRDPDRWKALRVRTMKEYGDREWARRMYRQGLRRRIREGRFGHGRSARDRKPFERARGLSGEAPRVS